jgi:hypothetical protein
MSVNMSDAKSSCYPFPQSAAKANTKGETTMTKWLILGSALFTAAMAFAPSAADAGSVRGYYRRDGTYVQPHYRTNPDGRLENNYGYPGNWNPNKGQFTPGNPYGYPPRNPLNESPAGLEFVTPWPSQRR